MKIKITIAVILIVALMLLVALLGYILVFIFISEMTSGRSGFTSILAFIVAAIIFGYCMNFVIDRIKKLWQ